MLPRMTIDEIMTRYQLEPSLDDLFVEGEFDKEIIGRVIRHKNLSKAIYTIDSVDLSVEKLAQFGLTNGNRQRVIALWKIISTGKAASVRFVIDLDRDDLLQKKFSCSKLVYTKYCDIEAYFWRKEIIRSIVVDAARSKIGDFDKLFTSFCKSVETVFFLRASIEKLSLSWAIPDVTQSMSYHNSSISLDLANLLQRVGSRNGNHADLVAVERALFDLQSVYDVEDIRRKCQSHDVLQILRWVIRKAGGVPSVADSINRFLVVLSPEVADEIIYLI